MSQTINFSITVQPSTPPNPLKVVDANGNTLSNGDSVTLQPETVGTADTQTLFTVSGGNPPYKFNLASGSVPDGDSLNSTLNEDGSETVTLEGTPTTAGDSAFAISVSDSASASQTVSARKRIS